MSNHEKLILQHSYPAPDGGTQNCGTDNIGDGGGGLHCAEPGINVVMRPTGNPDEYFLTTDQGKNSLSCGNTPYGLVCNKGQTPDRFKFSNNCLQLKTQNGYVNCKADSIYDFGGIECSADITSCDNKFDMKRETQSCSCWEATSDGLQICSVPQRVKRSCMSEFSTAQVSKDWDIANTSHNISCHNTCSAWGLGKQGWQGVWHITGTADPLNGSSCQDKGWSIGCDCPSQQCHWY